MPVFNDPSRDGKGFRNLKKWVTSLNMTLKGQLLSFFGLYLPQSTYFLPNLKRLALFVPEIRGGHKFKKRVV